VGAAAVCSSSFLLLARSTGSTANLQIDKVNLEHVRLESTKHWYASFNNVAWLVDMFTLNKRGLRQHTAHGSAAARCFTRYPMLYLLVRRRATARSLSTLSPSKNCFKT
jgi:hypothetical protein